MTFVLMKIMYRRGKINSVITNLKLLPHYTD